MKLARAPAMQDANTTRIIHAVGAGGEDEVRFVGGCVRDALLRRPIKDIDLGTTALPETVIARAEADGLKAVPTGIEHGTVTVISNHIPVEVTTLRRDVETDGRRAVVAFTTDWREDALRRDLTMNALSLSPDGVLHDYFGGVADAEAGRVRFVGVAEERIREDVLRILRFFRFHAHYGRTDPDAEGLAACKDLAHLIPTLSAERVHQETLRLLEAPDPTPTLELASRIGVWRRIGVGEAALDKFRRFLALDIPITRDPLLRLACLIDGAVAPGALATKLRLSNREKRRLEAWADFAAQAPPNGAGLNDALYRRGADAIDGAAALSLAGPAPDPGWRAALDAAENWKPRTLPIKGRDLVALGLDHGPAIGAIRARVEAWWIDKAFAPDRAACLAEARRLIDEAAG
ncbi:MAG: CCA tRNA nucleotidyltransferase [Alphaproteobacteria bacterium]|nr:CCA tRNA nucleotidyltransferase [Alphaproteobacteria bacterium]